MIRRYAAALGADLILTQPRPAPPEPEDVPLRTLREAAAGARYDLLIATWWATADGFGEVPAARHALFVQSLEQRFYPAADVPEALGAAEVLGLPVDFLVIAEHMERFLARLRPDARVWRVPNGIDKPTFAPRPRAARDASAPLRVLVEGQPSLWFKGVPEAVAATRAMREPAQVTVIAQDPAAIPDGIDADRITGGLDAAGMAELYAEHDVLLKLSRLEGLPLPPLEAFHVGLPCVVTPFTGSEEIVEPRVNGLVVEFDDLEGTAAALDRLAREPELLARLSQGALATAQRWPDAREATDRFVSAVDELLAAPAPEGLGRILRDRRLAAEVVREDRRRAAVALEHMRAARDHFEALDMSAREQIEFLAADLENWRERAMAAEEWLVLARGHAQRLEEVLEGLRAEHEDLKRRHDIDVNSKAYRAAVRARGAIDVVRRRG